MSRKENIIKVIESHISMYRETEYINKNKYEFLNTLDFDYYNLSHLNMTDIFKLYYSCFSNTSFDIICNKFDFLSEYLNRIKPKHFIKLNEIYNFFNEILICGDPYEFYMEQDTYENMLTKFNTFKYPDNIKKFIIDIFSDEEKINFNAYNGFLNLCNSLNKITIIGSISFLIEIATYEIDGNETPIMKKEIDKIIKKEYPELINNINMMIRYKEKLREEQEKFDKNKFRQIKVLEETLNNINNNQKVNIDKIKRFIDNNLLIAILLDYNNGFLVNEYESLLDENEKLRNNSINRRDVLLKELDFKIDVSKILIDDDELEYKLNAINKYFSEAKKYNNIVLMLINKIPIEDFEILKKVIIDNSLEQIFILDNIKRLCIKEEFDNFIANINLFRSIGLNIKNIIRFDNEIIFFNNNSLNKIINHYLAYGINFDCEISNYKFLYNDYSYIIDKFIEIGEYDLIIKNPSLINEDSNIIIKRCIFNKDINEPIINEQGKLIGNLRKESSFPLNGKELNESIIENYEELIPKDVIELLNNNELSNYEGIDLKQLDTYKVHDCIYNINGLIVSTNKVKRNINILLNSDLKELYTFNEMLFYAIIYKYPKLITRDNIIMLRNLLEIKTKTLEVN